MKTVTLSEKYQVVIPKEVRKGLKLKPGQKLRISRTKSGDITIKTNSALDELYGSVKGAWGDDPAEYIRKQRDEWDD